MIRLRTKVVELSAVLWDGTSDSLHEIVKFAGSARVDYDGSELKIWNYLEARWFNTPVGHYVIEGLKGEHHSCESEALFLKYTII